MISRPMKSISEAGSRPCSMSLPTRLHSVRRKYSWRGYERNYRESVSMPTKRLNRPSVERAFICFSMPSF